MVFGKGSCLVRADVVDSSHCLAGLEVSNQVVLIFHLAHTVCKGDGDGKREPLRHCHNNYTDSDDKVRNQLLDCSHAHEGGSEGWGSHTVNDVVSEHGQEGDNSRKDTKVSDLGCQDLQLLLKWSIIRVLLDLHLQTPILGSESNSKHHVSPCSFDNLGP